MPHASHPHGTFRVYFRKKCYHGTSLNSKKIRKLPDFIQEKSVATTVQSVANAIKTASVNGCRSVVVETLSCLDDFVLDRFSKGEAALETITEKLRCCKNFISTKKPVRPFCKKCKPWELEAIRPTQIEVNNGPSTSTTVLKDLCAATSTKDIKPTTTNGILQRTPTAPQTVERKAIPETTVSKYILGTKPTKSTFKSSVSKDLLKTTPKTLPKGARKDILEATSPKDISKSTASKGTLKTAPKTLPKRARKDTTETTTSKDILGTTVTKSISKSATTKSDILKRYPTKSTSKSPKSKDIHKTTPKTPPKRARIDIPETTTRKDISKSATTKDIPERSPKKSTSKSAKPKEIHKTTPKTPPKGARIDIPETTTSKDILGTTSTTKCISKSATTERCPTKSTSISATTKDKLQRTPTKSTSISATAKDKLERTPTKSTSISATTKDKLERTPTKSTSISATAKDKLERTPTKSTSISATAKDKLERTPTKSTSISATAKDKLERTPTKSTSISATAKDKLQRTPTKSTPISATAKDKLQRTPTKSTSISVTAKDKLERTPTKSTSISATAKDKLQRTPTKSTSISATAKDKLQRTPTKSTSISVTAKDKLERTPTKSTSISATAKDKLERTPKTPPKVTRKDISKPATTKDVLDTNPKTPPKGAPREDLTKAADSKDIANTVATKDSPEVIVSILDIHGTSPSRSSSRKRNHIFETSPSTPKKRAAKDIPETGATEDISKSATIEDTVEASPAKTTAETTAKKDIVGRRWSCPKSAKSKNILKTTTRTPKTAATKDISETTATRDDISETTATRDDISETATRDDISKTGATKDIPETAEAKDIPETAEAKDIHKTAEAKDILERNPTKTTSKSVTTKNIFEKFQSKDISTKDILQRIPTNRTFTPATTEDILETTLTKRTCKSVATKNNLEKSSTNNISKAAATKDILEMSPSENISQTVEINGAPKTASIKYISEKVKTTLHPARKAQKPSTKLYTRKKCCIGEHLNPVLVARFPKAFQSESIATLGKIVLESIVKCAYDVEKVFNLVPYGTGNQVVEVQIGDDIQRRSYPYAHSRESLIRLLERFSYILGLCPNYFTFTKPDKSKCNICRLQQSNGSCERTDSITIEKKDMKRRLTDMDDTTDETPAKKHKKSVHRPPSFVCKEFKVVIDKLPREVVDRFLRPVVTKKEAFLDGKKVTVILPESRYLTSPKKLLFSHITEVPSMTEAVAEGVDNLLNEDRSCKTEEELGCLSEKVDIDSECFLEDYIPSPTIPNDDDIDVIEGQGIVETVEDGPLSVLFERGNNNEDITSETELYGEDEFTKNATECERSLMLFSPKSFFGDLDDDSVDSPLEKEDDLPNDSQSRPPTVTTRTQQNSESAEENVEITPIDVASSSKTQILDENSNEIDLHIVKVEKPIDTPMSSLVDIVDAMAASTTTSASTSTIATVSVSAPFFPSHSVEVRSFQKDPSPPIVTSSSNTRVSLGSSHYPLLRIPESRVHNTRSSKISNTEIAKSSNQSYRSKTTPNVAHSQTGLSNQPLAVPGTGIVLPPMNPISKRTNTSLPQKSHVLNSSNASPRQGSTGYYVTQNSASTQGQYVATGQPYYYTSSQTSFQPVVYSDRMLNGSYVTSNQSVPTTYSQARHEGAVFQYPYSNYRPPVTFTSYGASNYGVQANATIVSSPEVAVQGRRSSFSTASQSSSPVVQNVLRHSSEPAATPHRSSSVNPQVQNTPWYPTNAAQIPQSSSVPYQRPLHYANLSGHPYYAYLSVMSHPTPVHDQASTMVASTHIPNAQVPRPINVVPPQKTRPDFPTTSTAALTSPVGKVTSPPTTPSQLLSTSRHLAIPPEKIPCSSLEAPPQPTSNPSEKNHWSLAIRQIFAECDPMQRINMEHLLYCYLCKKRQGYPITNNDIAFLVQAVGPRARRTLGFKTLTEALLSNPNEYSSGVVQGNAHDQASGTTAQEHPAKPTLAVVEKIVASKDCTPVENTKRLEEAQVRSAVGSSNIQIPSAGNLHSTEPTQPVPLSLSEHSHTVSEVLSKGEDHSKRLTTDATINEDVQVFVCTEEVSPIAPKVLSNGASSNIGKDAVSPTIPSSKVARLKSSNPSEDSAVVVTTVASDKVLPKSSSTEVPKNIAEMFVSSQGPPLEIEVLDSAHAKSSDSNERLEAVVTCISSDEEFSSDSEVDVSENLMPNSSSCTSGNDLISGSADQLINLLSTDDQTFQGTSISTLSNNNNTSNETSAMSTREPNQPFYKAFMKKIDEFDKCQRKRVYSALFSLLKKLRKDGHISTGDLINLKSACGQKFRHTTEYTTLIEMLKDHILPNQGKPDATDKESCTKTDAEMIMVEGTRPLPKNTKPTDTPSESSATDGQTGEDIVSLSDIVGMVNNPTANEPADTEPETAVTPSTVAVAPDETEPALKLSVDAQKEVTNAADLPAPVANVSNIHDYTVLIWNLPQTALTSTIAQYEIYAIQLQDNEVVREDVIKTKTWKQLGVIKALPPPMAITLTNLFEGLTSYIVVRAVDHEGRVGPFSALCEVKARDKLTQ